MPNSTPNYLTVGPNGEVGAEFPGGVIINAVEDNGPAVTGPTDKAVTWKRAAGGALVASVWGWKDTFSNADAMTLSSGVYANDEWARLHLITDPNSNVSSVYVEVRHGANYQNKLLLNSNGLTDF